MASEEQKEMIRKEARGILDKFAKTLDSIKGNTEISMPNGKNREERSGLVCDEGFRARMFANAHSKDKDCIIAEKGAWV